MKILLYGLLIPKLEKQSKALQNAWKQVSFKQREDLDKDYNTNL